MKNPNLLLMWILTWVISLPLTALSQPQVDEAVEAVQKSDLASLVIWFADGGDINLKANNDNTLLMLASKIGDKKTLDYLIVQQPDVNARNKAGTTALMIAAKYGNSYAVETLLKVGADPAIRNNRGITAARFALAYNHGSLYDQLQEAELRARSNS